MLLYYLRQRHKSRPWVGLYVPNIALCRVQKLYRRKSIQHLIVWTFAFRSIKSLCWIVSNDYSESKNQRLGTFKTLYTVGLKFVFTTLLHHITNAASSKLKLLKTRPPLFCNAVLHSYSLRNHRTIFTKGLSVYNIGFNWNWMRCTSRVSPWPYYVFVHCWTADVDTGQWAEPSSLCWWHSDLRFLFTDAVFVRGTTAPYFRMHWRCRQLAAVKQAPAEHQQDRSHLAVIQASLFSAATATFPCGKWPGRTSPHGSRFRDFHR